MDGWQLQKYLKKGIVKDNRARPMTEGKGKKDN
jgi:hypothetical protein